MNPEKKSAKHPARLYFSFQGKENKQQQRAPAERLSLFILLRLIYDIFSASPFRFQVHLRKLSTRKKGQSRKVNKI